MKEIVVISGKGGTGKTSLTAAFAVLAGPAAVVADCDVDAADLHLLLDPDFAAAEPFRSGRTAVIDPDRCAACGECADVCRFDAVEIRFGGYRIDPVACAGCGYCVRVCPAGAITEIEAEAGHWYRSRIRTGAVMIHARLGIGADNSGKLVAKVKSEAKAEAARSGRPLVLVDGPPGVGCPVVSSLSGASFTILVTEATVSGLHDLRRVHELVRRFGLRAGCIVNKADLNPAVREEIRTLLAAEGIVPLAEIPYDEAFTAAITRGRTIVEQEDDLAATVRRCWDEITRQITLTGHGSHP